MDDVFEDDPLFAPDDSVDQEQIHDLMDDYDLEREDAERISELMDEYDLDPEDAMDIDESLEGW